MMKNAIVFFSFICFLAFSLTLKAQEKLYTLQIHTVGNYLPQPHYNKFSFKPVSGLAIQAERSIWGNLGLGLKYSFWLPWKWSSGPYQHPLVDRIRIISEMYINEEGYVDEGRYNYHFLDLFACYKYSVHPRHQFSIRQSASYATGKIDYFKYDYNPWGGDFGGVGKTEKENYWGGVTQLSYDYLLWKKRINIGGDIGARYYFGLPYVNFTYEAHIGFNF